MAIFRPLYWRWMVLGHGLSSFKMGGGLGLGPGCSGRLLGLLGLLRVGQLGQRRPSLRWMSGLTRIVMPRQPPARRRCSLRSLRRRGQRERRMPGRRCTSLLMRGMQTG